VIATEMRRDSRRILDEDNFQVIIDTFHDLRSGYMFVGPHYRDAERLSGDLMPFPFVSSAVLCPGFLFLHCRHFG